MKIRLVFSALILMGLLACDKDEHQPCHVPECLEDIIAHYEPLCDASTIESYIFQNQFVYVLNDGGCCCDHFSYVLTESCDTLGFLGGIAGFDTINGESFQTAVLQDTIWP